MSQPAATRDEHPARAMIWRLRAQPNGTADRPPTVNLDGAGIPVQFNPTSLRVQRQSNASGGATAQAQRRQHANEGHDTLSFDLEFDTAEGDANGRLVDVRSLTGQLRQFIEPPLNRPKDAPPRLRFVWGAFRFDGILTSFIEDIDYFAPDGMALRTKVSLVITGQDLKFEALERGSGNRLDRTSTGPPPGAAGAPPARDPDTAVAAQDGESVQQLLTRVGADPANWRSAMRGLDSPLGLAAGAQVQLSASAVIGGIGMSAGFGAGAGLSARAGLSTGAVASAGAALTAATAFSAGAETSAGAKISAGLGSSAEVGAGFALAAAGGTVAAGSQLIAARADAAAAQTRASFDVPAAAAIGRPTADGVVGVMAIAGASASVSARVSVDPRSMSYGRGVPLQIRASATAR